jgi:rhodanese-related sulfurtransferase
MSVILRKSLWSSYQFQCREIRRCFNTLQLRSFITEKASSKRLYSAERLSSFCTPSPTLNNSTSVLRYCSTPARLPPVTQYEDVKRFLDEGGLVVDVREAKELENDGRIDNAVHIPLRQVKEAFELNPDHFEKKYQVKMPEDEDPIIFTCLAGIRSAKAEAVVNSMGFSNTSNYLGGFADWVQKNQ